jgi:spermidine synthase
VESPYQYLTVRRDTYPEAAEQVLTINEGTYTYHSVRVLGRVLTGSRYYDTYALIPFLLDLDPGTELRGAVLGLACGVNVGQWKHFWSPVHRLKIDGAELDPEVVVLGRTYFDLPGPEASWLRTVVMDGRQMLEALPTEHRYHVLVVDAFTNELYVPFHLATREFFELCRRRMEPGAILAMNVYARGEEAPNLRAIENTLATVFGRCLRLRLYDEGGFLLLARRGAGEIELARLDAQHIQERFDPWEGFAAWSMIPEWDDLLRLAAETRDAGATGSVREILPAAEAIVLTDDHAPLAWLTDRFLGELEEVGLAGDDERGLALRSLIARQGRTLWIVGLVWSGFLAFGFVLLHRSMPAATACAGTTTRPCRPRRR